MQDFQNFDQDSFDKVNHFTDSFESPDALLTNVQKQTEEFNSFYENDLIVHVDYGVGKFIKVETLKVLDCSRDYLKILYYDDDILYVPVEDISLLKKYGNNSAVQLDKLGSSAWGKRKNKIKQFITELSLKLINIAALRKMQKSDQLLINRSIYEKVANSFQFKETADQLKAIQEIENDLFSGKLMDRVICGDVGFGKTEVMIRAAAIIAASGQQVMILTPTTILARQHFKLIQQRFENIEEINVAELSRFVSQPKQIKQKVADGEINIVVGTHALLAKDVKFANLGLIAIDEEHHFGVKHKEKLKEANLTVHTLALSATPIPRTLQMSLVGIKDLSIICSPPQGRISIKTIISTYNEDLIQQALMFEYNRGGQAFYIIPNISDMQSVYQKLSQMVPQLRIIIAHGQMNPEAIDDAMTKFYEKECDILLATSIIESGIDLASANTIIIEKAELFGLSQLYQLRGRVGRRKIQGYAYIITKDLSVDSNSFKRLEIMKNIDYLGAGFDVAAHDMDIRGFGNLVGTEQAGKVKEVGIELYNEMLRNSIKKIKNLSENQSNTLEDPEDVYEQRIKINLNVPIYIPHSYIDDHNLRLRIYRKIGNLTDLAGLEKFKLWIIKDFGIIPIELNNLFDVVELKLLAKKSGILVIDRKNHKLEFTFINPEKAKEFCDKIKGQSIKITVFSNIRIAVVKNLISLSNMNIIQECQDILSIVHKKGQL